MEFREVLSELERHSNPESVEGMARFGITPSRAHGVVIPVLRGIARRAGRDHRLGLRLWGVDTRETRILASMIAEPGKVSDGLMDEWVCLFDYWEICDQVCMNLFEKTPHAWRKASEWAGRREEYVRRAGFVLMARLAVSDKQASDEKFEAFFPHIISGSQDERLMVKKGVSWALRQIGKRNAGLNESSVHVARKIKAQDSKSARWVAGDVLRELEGDAVKKRLFGF